jgi:SAM-dependent methyltransferase
MNFWDREIVEQKHIPWMGIPEVRQYINQLIGGDEMLWPMDWLQRWLAGRRFGRVLSIGCGGGALERQLIESGLAQSVDAFDGSVNSLRLARQAADAAGYGAAIRYFAADFNEPSLPARTYDAVFFHQSAHHVGKLEKLYRAILRALKADGLLYLDEYVGPSSCDWNDALIAPQRAEYAAIDPRLRTHEVLPYPIQVDDPTEAIRSSEIEPQLRIGFEVVARRPMGGTLLALLMPQLRIELLTPAIIERLINRERALLAGGMPSYYAIIVARPKRGMRKTWARLRYFIEPKAKAQRIKLRRRFTGH